MKGIFSIKQIGLLIILAIAAAVFANNMPAEWFDNFGLIVFTAIGILALWEIKTKKETPDWVSYALFVIAVLGLIVDGTIVIRGVIG